MNLYLDTSYEDFVLVLFDNNFKVVDYILLQGYKKKVNLITAEFSKILDKNNLDIDKLGSLYTNIGPGFFTGVRSSLVFLRTIALVNHNKMFITTTLDLLRQQYPSNSKFHTDAQGKKIYEYNLDIFDENNYAEAIKVIHASDEIALDKVDYQEVINNFANYKNCFIEMPSMEIEPLYIKEPQIGGQK
ncbi:hypothetical protein H9M94_01590 [Mycoplasma sp. Pen4]|uniref:hypothetical protein n=1 Tax=Mycoplasma sp. Pen4 TaxID=640330 RepID=UPI0016546B21|nr:hypothetical protein [Mycoplasma sp. Pen4]QNM93947.1 hypothetical protein H9M94_01590 [Mycoplasma sp. Pen4]